MKIKPTFSIRFSALSLALIFLLSSCVSTTTIKTVPPGADVYIDGFKVGTTPYKYEDEKIVFSRTNLDIILEGYEPVYTYLVRDEELDLGPVVGGFFFWPVWLWSLKYKPLRTYDLVPLGNAPENPKMKDKEIQFDDATIQKLNRLKESLDNGTITQEEYDLLRKKTLGLKE